VSILFSLCDRFQNLILISGFGFTIIALDCSLQQSRSAWVIDVFRELTKKRQLLSYNQVEDVTRKTVRTDISGVWLKLRASG
jgi:hypothetical protein